MFEIISFTLWIIATFAIDQYQHFVKESIINKALSQKLKLDSNKTKSNKQKKQLQQMSHEDDIEKQQMSLYSEASTINSTLSLDRSNVKSPVRV